MSTTLIPVETPTEVEDKPLRENELEVLEYLNGLREEFEIGPPLEELPPDLPEDDPRMVSQGCPVAVALNAECGIGVICLRLKNGFAVEVRFPDFVSKFQNDHDHRRYRRYR